MAKSINIIKQTEHIPFKKSMLTKEQLQGLVDGVCSKLKKDLNKKFEKLGEFDIPPLRNFEVYTYEKRAITCVEACGEIVLSEQLGRYVEWHTERKEK